MKRELLVLSYIEQEATILLPSSQESVKYTLIFPKFYDQLKKKIL